MRMRLQFMLIGRGRNFIQEMTTLVFVEGRNESGKRLEEREKRKEQFKITRARIRNDVPLDRSPPNPSTGGVGFPYLVQKQIGFEY